VTAVRRIADNSRARDLAALGVSVRVAREGLQAADPFADRRMGEEKAAVAVAREWMGDHQVAGGREDSLG